MRFRIGLLQDTAAIDKQIAKDAAEAKKPPTVKTEAQTKADEARGKEGDKGKEKKKPKIRPLAEAKAIDLGANFVSETFLLAVGVALILFENARKGRQEATRREDVADQIEELKGDGRLYREGLVELEKELLRLRARDGTVPGKIHSILPKSLHDIEEEDEDDGDQAKGWMPWAQGLFGKRTSESDTPETANSQALKLPTQDNTADPVTSAPSSTLGQILQRTHPRDINLQTTNHMQNPTRADEPPKETSSNAKNQP